MSPGSRNSENQSISVGNSLLPNTLHAPPEDQMGQDPSGIPNMFLLELPETGDDIFYVIDVAGGA